MRFTRRDFLKSSAALSAYAALPSIWMAARNAKALEVCEQGRNLVIIQLEGGNDGTNTVIPHSGGYRAAYQAMRAQLGIATADLDPVQLGEDPGFAGAQIALHPHMVGLKNLHDSGNLATLVGTHYPNGSLSHFDSERVWYTGNVVDPRSGEPGWMGQTISHLCSGQVTALPAMDIQRELTPLFHGTSQVLAIEDLSTLAFPVPESLDMAEALAYRAAFDAAYAAIRDGAPGLSRDFALAALAGLERIDAFQAVDFDQALNLNDLLTGASNGAGGFGNDGAFSFGLAEDLRLVFAVMRGGPPGVPLGPRIFRVRINGFDTHSFQGVHTPLSQKSLAEKRADDFDDEFHGELLYSLDQAIAAFWQDCIEKGVADRTMIMTFSEFSRRPVDNTTNSQAGTDHGTLGPMFVVGPNPAQAGVGPALQGGLYGTYPDMTDLNDDENYKFNPSTSLDFRNMYAEIMTRWLDVDSTTTENILGLAPTPLGFIP